MAHWCNEQLVVELETPAGKSVVTLDQPFARVGSHPDSDVVIDDDAVAKRAVYLHATEQGVFCVFLEVELGVPGKRGAWLAPSRSVALGSCRFTARLASAPVAAAAELPNLASKRTAVPPRPVVAISARGQLRDTRALRADLRLLGRRPQCSPQLVADSVSTFHAVLYWDGSDLWCVDLVSTGGTRLNGKRIVCSPLAIGDHLRIGEFDLYFKRLEHQETSQPEAALPATADESEASVHAAVAGEHPAAASSESGLSAGDSAVAQREQQLQDEIARLMHEKQASESEAAKRAQREQQWQDEIARLTREKQASDAEIAKATQRVQEMQDEIARLTREKQASDAELRLTAQREQQQVAQRQQEMQDEIARLGREKQAGESGASLAALRVQQLQDEVARLTREMQAGASEQRQALERDQQQAAQREQQLQDEVARRTREKQAGEAEVRLSAQREQQLRDEIARLIQEKQASDARWEQTAHELRVQIVQLRETADQLAARSQTLEARAPEEPLADEPDELTFTEPVPEAESRDVFAPSPVEAKPEDEETLAPTALLPVPLSVDPAGPALPEAEESVTAPDSPVDEDAPADSEPIFAREPEPTPPRPLISIVDRLAEQHRTDRWQQFFWWSLFVVGTLAVIGTAAALTYYFYFRPETGTGV